MKLSFVLAFIVFLLTLFYIRDRKRITYLEKENDTPCPWMRPFAVDTFDPCLKRCPLHRGICYRWHQCRPALFQIREDKR